MKLDQFKEIRIDDRGVIKPVLDAANKVSCDYNFANIFMWADIFRLRWALDEGRLLVLSLRDDVTLMPVGPGVTPGYLCALANAFGREGKSGGFVLADALFVEGNPRITECFEPSIDGDNADYVYATRALVELKGRRLHKKKNLLSQFLRNNPDYRCEPIARGHFADCFTLAEKWCEDRNCESLGFTHETSALRRGFDQFEALNLEGLVVSSRGAMVAFSIFSRQNTVTADIHFEKYDPAVKGAAQLINWETARRLLDRFAYLNREQDLGIKGLRRAKQSYCPEFTVKTYSLTRRLNGWVSPS